MRPFFRSFALLLALVPVIQAKDYFDEIGATTFFAFDTVSIPYSQNLSLKMRQPRKHPANPVVRRGVPGSPDALAVQFYGSVIREGARYRMWYVAQDDDSENRTASSRWRAAYAESENGLVWSKPSLGLVEFGGDRNNNLLLTEPGPWGFVNLKVLHEPEDPDPSRRYKMTTHVYYRHNTRLGTLLPFVSADGLVWKPVKDVAPHRAELRKDNLFLPGVHFEPCGGLFRWDGFYYLSGQNAMRGIHDYQGRVSRHYRSADFVNWMPTSHVAFVRDTQHESLGAGRSREGEQNHEGISVWHRGNVLLGVYGRWHGALEWKDVTIDLGFVLSNDGLHFREPKREWTLLARGEDGAWDEGGLLQGQGFENIGEETYLYYGAWDPRGTGGPPRPRGGVGIASLPRDRFGDLVVDNSGEGPGDYQWPEVVAEFVTAPLEATRGAVPRLHLNASGLGPDAALRVELLDLAERPVPGYAGEDAALVEESGYQTPVVWSRGAPRNAPPKRYKLRVVFEGKKRNEIRFHALYSRQ